MTHQNHSKLKISLFLRDYERIFTKALKENMFEKMKKLGLNPFYRDLETNSRGNQGHLTRSCNSHKIFLMFLTHVTIKVDLAFEG